MNTAATTVPMVQPSTRKVCCSFMTGLWKVHRAAGARQPGEAVTTSYRVSQTFTVFMPAVASSRVL